MANFFENLENTFVATTNTATDVAFGNTFSYANVSNTIGKVATTVGAAGSVIGNVNNVRNALDIMTTTSDPAQAARAFASGLNSVNNVINTVENVAALWADPQSNQGTGYGSGGNGGGYGNIGSNGRVNGGGGAGYGGGSQSPGRLAPRDWKVSLRCPGLGMFVEFPITPNIQTTDTAKYSSVPLTHSNYAMQFYESSEVSSINISAEFPVQNSGDGLKLLGAVNCFRAATKMFWGGDALAGTPPPLLFLKGYGGYFTEVPCTLTSFTHTMPEDKDYISVGADRVPTLSTLQLVLQPVYSRNQLIGFSPRQIAAGRGGPFI